MEGKFFWESWKNLNLPIAYHREHITGSQHKVEAPLKPAHIYFWAVKSSGSDRDWSYYNYHLFVGYFYYYWPKLLFRFKTPNDNDIVTVK